jgi:hypothetical protein
MAEPNPKPSVTPPLDEALRRKDPPRALARRDAGSLVIPVLAIATGAVFSTGALLLALADDNGECAMSGKRSLAQEVRRELRSLLPHTSPIPEVRTAGAPPPVTPVQPLPPEDQPNVDGGLRSVDPLPSAPMGSSTPPHRQRPRR